MEKPIISFVVAMSKQTRAIGKDGALLWRIPRDLVHFKSVTMGHPMIMGRKTFESIGRSLPGRMNIVVTQNHSWSHEDVAVCHSPEEALALAKSLDPEEVTVIGGAHLFTYLLPFVTRIYLTLVDDPKEGDAYMPDFSQDDFHEISREEGEHNGIPFSILTLDRNTNPAVLLT